MEKTILYVPAQDIQKRIDVYLSEQFPQFSRSFFKNLLKDLYIKVNNITLSKCSYAVKYNDQIEISFPSYEAVPLESKDQDIGVKVIFEHKDFLIIYKPAFLVVHKPCLKSKDFTLVDWLLHHFKDLDQVGAADRPGIVHRLDKDTSGLMIIAKNNYAHMIFADMFKNRTISKTYMAVVEGHPPLIGTIKDKISRDPIHRNKMSAKYDHGRESLTHYKVIQYFKETALVRVTPITGRTHQIRVHFTAMGHSLIGDSLYGKSSKLIARQALHAQRLAFEYEGKYFVFWINLPADMQALIENSNLKAQERL